MAGETTSAVYTVWRAITRLCRDAAWPANGLNGKPMTVYFGDPDAVPANIAATRERIIIASSITPPEETWGPNGRLARDESFTVFVYAFTAIAGRTTEQAAQRLEEMTAELETVVHTINADRTTNDGPAEFDPYRPWFIEVSALAPNIVATDEGAVGRAEIALRCKFRIGIPPVTA